MTKHGVDLVVESSPDKQVFQELIDKQKKRYEQQQRLYVRRVSNPTPSARSLCEQYPTQLVPKKRKESETELIEVPLDPNKRLKFFAADLFKLSQGNTTNIGIYNEEGSLIFPIGLQQLLNVSGPFEEYKKTVFQANSNQSYLTLEPNYVNNSVNEVANVFIDCIIRFDNVYFYVTSVDIFCT